MKKMFHTALAVTLAAILCGCGPKEVQPIQSLSDIKADEIHVTDVNVGLGTQFVEFYSAKIDKEEEIIRSQQERIANLSDVRSRENKLNREAAEKNIEKAEKKKASLHEEMTAVPVDVETAIRSALKNKFGGSREVNLDVTVDSLTLTNGAAVFLVGGSDSMTGTLKINDAKSNELLGEYHITNFDSNGGLIGAVARGDGVRGKMFNEFSSKISGILAGEYADE